MNSRQDLFDRLRLLIRPIRERKHDLHMSDVLPLEPSSEPHETFKEIATRIARAGRQDNPAAVVFMMGAHVIRAGVQRYLIDLMERRLISCLAMNGAGVIHDFETSLIGATTESVSTYIKDGRFGLWRETGRINDIVSDGYDRGMGLGESVGRVIEEEGFPHKDISLLAHAYRLGIPATVHVGIGYDIVHEHPNCNGAAYGATSYTDFLRFARVLENLDRGVVMNFGSSVMAPEVFLKALAMARNVAGQEGRSIVDFAALVCDLKPLPSDYGNEPHRNQPDYYFRPWKTMLVRTTKDGGKSFYVQGDHRETVPHLWTAVVKETTRSEGE